MPADPAGRRILIVEDEYFIADDMAQAFKRSGAVVVGPVPTAEEALDLLGQDAGIDGAVLDINLQGEMVWPVADRLIENNIPFVFATGYDGSTIPPRYAQVTRCEKPIGLGKVVQALFG